MNLFPIFFTNAGSKAIRQKDLKQAQLRVAYSLLYYTGLRINEIREITHKQILDAIPSSQFNVIHHKTKQAHIHVLSSNGVEKLKRLSTELIIVQAYYFKVMASFSTIFLFSGFYSTNQITFVKYLTTKKQLKLFYKLQK